MRYDTIFGKDEVTSSILVISSSYNPLAFAGGFYFFKINPKPLEKIALMMYNKKCVMINDIKYERN